MSALTYLKSAVSYWFVHQNEPIRNFYFNTLRPLYMKRASLIEIKQWERMGLKMRSAKEIQLQIRNSLAKRLPLSVAKIGATEFFMLRWWLGEKVIASRVNDLYGLSGVFPFDIEFFPKFAAAYAQALKTLDVLGLWTGKDEPSVYGKLGLTATITYHENFSGNFCAVALGEDPGWILEMKGYRVMIISSFAEIFAERANEADWNRYWNGRIPWFEPANLTTVPFPYGFERPTQEKYSDSLDLLEKFKIDHQETMENSDIILLGCGAYAVPLLEWTRAHGKVGIHMGGEIQLLFGIKGGRWDETPGLYNEHWIRPPAHLVPNSAARVENSCYW